LLRSQLFNVSSTDVGTYVAGISIVTVVALLAAALPVRRAATVDPMKALRLE
jgi:ABC-type antimicrobial peptide transport system permease subunit